MSPTRVERALARLCADGAVLAADRGGGYGVFPGGDRRRRPTVRLGASVVRELESAGAIIRSEGDALALTEAGRARVRRSSAAAGEAFVAQHADIGPRAVIDPDGDVKHVRGAEPNAVLRRLAALRGAGGEAWLSGAELAAAGRLWTDWRRSQVGQVRSSDWTAPPISGSARGGGNGQEAAMARRCDARRRIEDALQRLAPPLRRVVERVCLHEDGLEALERAEGWPSRSGKLALKLGLAQLAAGF
jgi:hypothetical protein